MVRDPAQVVVDGTVDGCPYAGKALALAPGTHSVEEGTRLTCSRPARPSRTPRR